MEPTSMGTARREGIPKLWEPEDMKDPLEKCAGEESKASECLKVPRPLPIRDLEGEKLPRPRPCPFSSKWEWSGRWEEPGPWVSWPLTVPARAVLSLGSWEAEKWVWAAGAGSQLTAG